jgi:transposase
MIVLPDGARLFAYSQPTDLRKGFAGLAALVQHQMGHDLLQGDLFLFMARNRRSLRVLQWDGTGLGLYCKRLATGRFAPIWTPQHRPLQLTDHQLTQLLAGVDITRVGPWKNS